MKFMLSLLALIAVVAALPAPSLPVNPGGIGGLFKGPNSEIIIKGPDGSVITSAQEGGEVHTKLDAIVVAEEAPAVVEPAPVAVVTNQDKEQSSDLIGPSGRIATQGSSSIVAGPASTTITGPAIVAETVVKDGAIIPTVTAGPIVTASTGPILGISEVSSGPVATVTGAPVAAISATGAPIAAVTGAPIATISANNVVATATEGSLTAIDVATVTGAPIVATNGHVATVTGETLTAIDGRVATVTGAPLVGSDANIATVTGAPLAASTLSEAHVGGISGNIGQSQISTISAGAPAISTISSGGIGSDVQTVSINNGIATAAPAVSNEPLARIPAATGTAHLAVATATSSGARATATLETIQPTVSLHAAAALPQVVSSTLAPPTITGLENQVNINNRVDLQLTSDQLAIDNRQINLNPGVIPNSNIIPPEIGLSARTPIDSRLIVSSTPRIDIPDRTLTPGLGAAGVATSNIQRTESEIGLTATQDQAILTNIDDRLLFTPTPNTAVLRPTPIPNLRPTARIDVNSLRLTPEQQQALQNQQPVLLSEHREQHQQIVDIRPRPRIVNNGAQTATLADIQQQQLLSGQLTKSGLDPSQIQLTNVPLSQVSRLDVNIDGRQLRDTNRSVD